ncbi:MAG: SEC-C domain-containing protein, partial [Elusimicrobia bacterium]|nr:SEC-C domain-containing protein [Elusimicrobiota bacterium]
YMLRNAILEGENLSPRFRDMLKESLEEKLALWAPEKALPEQWDFQSLNAWLSRSFEVSLEFKPEDYRSQEDLKEILDESLENRFRKREEDLGSAIFESLGRLVLLQVMDTAWVEHLTYLEQLRKGIFLRAYGQKDPLIEFQKEGFNLFESMMQRIREETLEYLFRIQVAPEPVQRAPRVMTTEKPEAQEPAPEGGSPAAVKTAPLITPAQTANGPLFAAKTATAELPEVKKIGRNDPCPCGSGKKHKKCCGK